MWCNQIFSLMSLTDAVTATYTIQNIIVADNYEIASKIARLSYGEDAIAVDTTQYALSIGNTYRNGEYYGESGEKLERNPTEAEQISMLKTQIADLVENEADLLYEVSLLQLGITE